MCTPGECLILLALVLALVSVSIAPSALSRPELGGIITAQAQHEMYYSGVGGL